ncbi:general substrate transporter [Aureobasidium sp. EXF-10727]|nr:general substrate transporter [Aureobasidium sp. EXF-10727]
MATTQQEMAKLMANVTPWYKDPGRRKLYALLLIALLSSATNGYDGSLMNGVQSITYYEKWGLVSLILGPYMADYGGRKWTIFLGCFIVVVAGIVQCLSINIHMFTAARFLIGLGSGFSGLGSPLLITEIAHPVERGKITALYNTQYYFGAFLGGWITFGTLYIKSNWSWRLPSLLQAAPSAIQLVLVILLPESPRWLMSRGRSEEALAILAKYHANGNAEDPLVRFQFAEMKASIALGEQKGRWSDLVSTKANRRRVFICLCCGVFSQFSGTSLTAYYLHNILQNIGIDSPNYQNMLNGFILMVNMFEAWFWACMVDRFGRRPLFLVSDDPDSVFVTGGSTYIDTLQICSTGMVCTFATWIALTAKQLESPKEKSWGKGVIAMIFFHNFFYNFAWPSLGVSYPLEILSFKIRANGLLMQNISTYVCLAISQYVIPLGISAGSWKFYFFFEGWLVIQLVTVFFCFPETRGATLEEINQTFDGVEAVEEVKNKAQEMEGVVDLRDMGTVGGKEGASGVEVTHVEDIHERKI